MTMKIRSYEQGGVWTADLWLLREQYTATGATQDEATAKLIEHMGWVLGIKEHEIALETERLRLLKDWLSQLKRKDDACSADAMH